MPGFVAIAYPYQGVVIWNNQFTVDVFQESQRDHNNWLGVQPYCTQFLKSAVFFHCIHWGYEYTPIFNFPLLMIVETSRRLQRFVAPAVTSKAASQVCGNLYKQACYRRHSWNHNKSIDPPWKKETSSQFCATTVELWLWHRSREAKSFRHQ